MLHYGEYILASNAFQKYSASGDPVHAQVNALFLKPANAMHNVGLSLNLVELCCSEQVYFSAVC